MPFEFVPQSIPDLVLVVPQAFEDDRGFFMETFKASEFVAHGLPADFVQTNHSRSVKGVVRGLHYQVPPFEQGKLVRVVTGAVWDVAVDIRPDSPNYGKWVAVELSEHNHAMFWIPGGFAHGFLAMTDNVHFEYQCTGEFRKDAEGGLFWNDPDLKIDWPLKNVTVSNKDAQLPLFSRSRPYSLNYPGGEGR